MIYDNGDSYEGNWKDGFYDGAGTYVFKTEGRRCVGFWKDNQPVNVNWIMN